MARFDLAELISKPREIRKFEHPTFGTIEYVLPTIKEQFDCYKTEDHEDGIKSLLYIMLSPANPTVSKDDYLSLNGEQLEDLYYNFIMKVLDFRGKIKSESTSIHSGGP